MRPETGEPSLAGSSSGCVAATRVGGRSVDRPVRWPWGTTGAAAVAGTAPWWASVEIPRAPRPGDPLGGGSAVPVSGPAAHDADGDGLADTLVVDTPAGTSIWSDLDGDGLADRVLAGDRMEDLLAVVLDAGR